MIPEIDKVHVGDALVTLKAWPDSFVDMALTSPPYWLHRDYGVTGQLGGEATPDEYVENLVKVFREVMRVIKPSGTFWLNMGDTYGYPTAKDLVGMPWLTALALRNDGWVLRQEIIWHKPNAMPESCRDRCVKSHESVFVLARGPKYYFDTKAIEEPAKWERWGNQTETKKHVGTARHLGGKTLAQLPIRDKKNPRDVWSISTRTTFRGDHPAMFPTTLSDRCILAGCPPGGLVLDPFMGAGTTGVSAKSKGRHYIGIELKPDYAAMAEKRIAETKGAP